MDQLGTYVIYLVMLCALAGGIASIFNSDEGLGFEFLEGLRSIGHIFIPVAGIMASIPYLSLMIESVFGPVFGLVGADPAIAATTLIAVDMGGYQLADTLATSRESWIMAMIVGYMAGATIVFSIPVGLALLPKSDHQYMALGIMSGILSIPVGVFVTCLILIMMPPEIRSQVSTATSELYQLQLDFSTLVINLMPLILFVVALALGLRFIPDRMITGFMWFGRLMDAGIKLVLVFSIIEYFTGAFSTVMGSWGFDPIIADKENQFRALEVAGYIGIMLAGAFPMVYLIQKYLARPMETFGKSIGLERAGVAGMMATIANILAMYRLIPEMKAKDKVLNIAFAVCAAFLFGDHLSFTANFQPTLILPLLIGKLSGGIFAFVLALKLSVPKALELEVEA